MTRDELQRLYDEATGKYRAAGIARCYSAQAVPALLGALDDYLAEPDPTVEIAYLKAKVADLSDEYHTRWTQGRRPPMSHDDIRAALEAASPGPWDYYRPHPNYGAYMVERVAPEGHLSGDCVAVCEDVDADANAHLIMHAPTWLAELLAENERLTARAEAAEAERDQLREEARRFAEALGFGDGRTERAATLAELVDPLTEAMSDSREHQECPVFCELCGERLAAVTCEACRGSGCLPNAEMAYLECGTCAGVGKVHNGCAEMTYAQLTARAEAAEQAIQRVRWQCDSWSHGNSWNKAARNAILRTLDGGAS